MLFNNMKILNRDAIKYIAMLTMLLNHIAHMFLTPGTVLYEVFEDVGFFTAPVMCFFLVEGYGYTRSKMKYGCRLLVFTVLSQIPYSLALRYGNLNVMYTLLCCFLILAAMDIVVDPVMRAIVCALLTLTTAVGDWAFIAPICTILLYNGKGNRRMTALGYGIVYVVFVLLRVDKYVAGGTQDDWTLHAVVHALLSGVGILAAAAVILFMYNGKRAERGRNMSKWFFYIFYPAHLMVLYLIEVYIIILRKER